MVTTTIDQSSKMISALETIITEKNKEIERKNRDIAVVNRTYGHILTTNKSLTADNEKLSKEIEKQNVETVELGKTLEKKRVDYRAYEERINKQIDVRDSKALSKEHEADKAETKLTATILKSQEVESNLSMKVGSARDKFFKSFEKLEETIGKIREDFKE